MKGAWQDAWSFGSPTVLDGRLLERLLCAPCFVQISLSDIRHCAPCWEPCSRNVGDVLDAPQLGIGPKPLQKQEVQIFDVTV